MIYRSDMETALAKQMDKDLFIEIEAFTQKLNVEPNKAWLQKTPDGKAEYIPIGILENQLRQDFAGLLQFELKSERRELNEFIVVATIKVFHPVIKQWMSYDGIGSIPIMQDAESTLDNFNSTKKKNALGKNAPNAYAEAIKNAAKKIGKKYGADINRKFEDAYEPENTVAATLDTLLPQMIQANNKTELVMLWETYPELQKSNNFKLAFTYHKDRLTKAGAWKD